MSKQKSTSIIPDERIIGKIFYIRGDKVMFDRDLAALYGVATKALKQAVRRNIKRFPSDFMFQLNKNEMDIWRSQIVTSKGDVKGLRWLPMVFTEQGVAMLSTVLNSERAIEVNIQIMRTFTKMRRLLASNRELARKIEKIERNNHKNRESIKAIFKVIAKFMTTDPKNSEIKIIGFRDKK